MKATIALGTATLVTVYPHSSSVKIRLSATQSRQRYHSLSYYDSLGDINELKRSVSTLDAFVEEGVSDSPRIFVFNN